MGCNSSNCFENSTPPGDLKGVVGLPESEEKDAEIEQKTFYDVKEQHHPKERPAVVAEIVQSSTVASVDVLNSSDAHTNTTTTTTTGRVPPLETVDSVSEGIELKSVNEKMTLEISNISIIQGEEPEFFPAVIAQSVDSIETSLVHCETVRSEPEFVPPTHVDHHPAPPVVISRSNEVSSCVVSRSVVKDVDEVPGESRGPPQEAPYPAFSIITMTDKELHKDTSAKSEPTETPSFANISSCQPPPSLATETHSDKDTNKDASGDSKVIKPLSVADASSSPLPPPPPSSSSSSPPPPSPDLDVPNITMGFLLKQGHQIKNWRLRFFVVEAGTIKYYEQKSVFPPYGKNIKGGFELDGCSVRTTIEGKFEIFSKSSAKYLLLENKDLSHGATAVWVNNIQRHIQYANSRKLV